MNTDYRTHPEYLALLSACRAVSEDDLPRLVLADWLDERQYHARAEWLRIEVRLHAGNAGKTVWRGLQAAGNEPFDLPGVEHYWTRRGFVTGLVGPFLSLVEHASHILPESIGLTVRLTDPPEFETRPTDTGIEVRVGVVVLAVVPADKFRDANHEFHANNRDMVPFLRLLWPDVANWELPPVRVGFNGRAYINGVEVRISDWQFNRGMSEDDHFSTYPPGTITYVPPTDEEDRILNGDPSAGRPLGMTDVRASDTFDGSSQSDAD